MLADQVKEAVGRVAKWLSYRGGDFIGSVNSDALTRTDLQTLLTALQAAESARDEAIKLTTQYAQEAGEAKGRLEMSEAAGIVDGWRERDAAKDREKVLLAERDEAREISSTFASHWPRGSDARDNALRIALGAVPSPAARALTPENSHAE